MLRIKYIFFCINNPDKIEVDNNYGKLSKQNFTLLFKSIITYLLSLFIITPIIGIAFFSLKALNIQPINNATSPLLFNKYGKYAFLFIGLLTPLIEESIFRLPLSFKKKHIILAILILGIVVGRIFYMHNNVIFLILLSATSILLVYLLVKYLDEWELKNIQTKYGKYFIYTSILIFTFLHLNNFEIPNIWTLPLYCLLLTSVLFSSILMTYLRLKVGLIYSILFHALNNTIILFLNI